MNTIYYVTTRALDIEFSNVTTRGGDQQFFSIALNDNIRAVLLAAIKIIRNND